MKATYQMNAGRLDLRLCPLMVIALLTPLTSAAEDIVDLSGSVGYTFRSLSSSGDDDTVSNQLRGTLNARSYLWQPWFATVDAHVAMTQDNTEFGDNTTNETTILTGDLDLNVMPKSRAPFQLLYRSSNSRVDMKTRESPLTTLGDKEYETTRLGLKQSYYTEKGDRYQLRYDLSNWSTDSGASFDDKQLGVEINLQRPKQRLVARTSYQITEQSQTDRESDNFVVNVDHFWYPSRSLRADSMFNIYNSDVTSTQPPLGTNQGDYNTDLLQLSNFWFWRPEDKPLTVSGGVRYYDLSADTTGNETQLQSVNATAGMFYQYSKYLRFDANLDVSTIDNGEDQAVTSKERGGVLYQSDILDIFSGFTYQWYATGSAQNQETEDLSIQSLGAKLGHDANKLWIMGEASTLRLSLSQSINESQQTGDADSSIQRLDNSASLGWDQTKWGGTSLIQLTVRDGRDFGDSDAEEQFVNFQAVRNQPINRSSSLSGNLTIQSVHRKFTDTGEGNTITTTTGQINYQHSRIFGVINLHFLSDLRISKAASDFTYDRAEWENRLDYNIGLLDISLSWRRIDTEADDFDLVYVQATRRFD